MTDYPTYFYQCGTCLRADDGKPLLDFEIVDCPHCGSTKVTRWQALPNLSREWAYCQAYGHVWQPEPDQPTVENCPKCGEHRSFAKTATST